MSCNLVSKKHIDALVQAGTPHPRDDRVLMIDDNAKFGMRLLGPEDRNIIGQWLLDANYDSVNDRYGDNTNPPLYQFTLYTKHLEAVDVLKAIDGFCYQTCESPNWETSKAREYLDVLRARMISRLPGYAESEAWAIT